MIETAAVTKPCKHCGEICAKQTKPFEGNYFCCSGCQTVFEILKDNNLCAYYDLNANPGIKIKAKPQNGKYDYLENETIVSSLLNFKGENYHSINLFLPAIHCSSCVWLLENFNKLQTGIITARLDFLKKELTLSYEPNVVTLKTIVELLTTIGYEPLINLSQQNENNSDVAKTDRRLITQIGLVGFCMGNIMLLSFPEYFHLNLSDASDALFQKFFLYLNFALSIPVFFYGAADYHQGAWRSLKAYIKKQTDLLSVDIPIAMGIWALFLRSTYETLFLQTAGYWDSLAGLVFFLLVGKWVQKTTFSFLSFERNYKSYFPLAAKVIDKTQEKGYRFLNISDLEIDDELVIHHQEIIPADSILVTGKALIDYSFVTGESQAIEVSPYKIIYAGGRQLGEALNIRVVKPVSQSYLTQLWNNEAFNKPKESESMHLADVFSKYFTFITIFIACGTAIYWQIFDDSNTWLSFTAVLMVACPCALTLSLPFAMDTALGIFGKNKFYVKNQEVIKHLTETTSIVFDKTGTLTKASQSQATFVGSLLSTDQIAAIKALASQSTHPLSKAIARNWQVSINKEVVLNKIKETKGAGIEACYELKTLKIGNADFIQKANLQENKSVVYVSYDGNALGYFEFIIEFRDNAQHMLEKMNLDYSLSLLSGDTASSEQVMRSYFKPESIFFNQKPQDKLNYIKRLQEKKESVLMVGDGLNDAGALKQSNVGIVVAEDTQAFSPACDAIIDATVFEKLPDFIDFSKTALKTVKASFILSLVYNAIAISIAAAGFLSPVKAAIFMPLSTLSVVLFAVGLTYFFAKRKGLKL